MATLGAFESLGTKSSPGKKGRHGLFLRKRIVKGVILAFFTLYALITLFPFYVLFVRTFVGTKDASELWFWLPPEEEISLEKAEIGNLAVFYNLDIKEFKEHFGIKGYVQPRMTLAKIAEAYDVPAEQIQAYIAPYRRFNGWIILFGRGTIWLPLLRTAAVTVAIIVLGNLLPILTGYGLAGLRRRDQMFIYNLYLLRTVIPDMMILLPQFFIIQWLIRLVPGTGSPGITRSLAQLVSLVMVNLGGGPLGTMVYTSAISAIPGDLEDAAYIDGAGRLRYLVHVVLPLLKVHIASMVVMTLPWTWNMFLQPYVYLDSANTTLIPLIQRFSGEYTTNFQVTFTAIFVSILPLATVYIIFRRWFIRGVMAGAVKG